MDRRAWLEAQQIRLRKRELRKQRANERAARSSRLLPKTKPRFASPPRTIAGPTPRNYSVLDIPSTFSFLDDPEQALETIHELEAILSDKETRFIEISHRRCRHLDLCASAVLDTYLMRERERARREQRPLAVVGKLSKRSFEVNAMLCAAGLPHRLGIKETAVPIELRDDFDVFEMMEGTASHPGSSKARDLCGTKLTEYFDKCLHRKHSSLTELGSYNLACLLTEVIGNAEEHGGPWHATGFWKSRRLRDSDAGEGEIHIVIFNEGRTIYEALQHPTSSGLMKSTLRQHSQFHSREFAASGGTWNEEALWTLYALQDQVSRFNFSEKGRNRGNGTIQMIQFFENLAAPGQRRCAFSRETRIFNLMELINWPPIGRV